MGEFIRLYTHKQDAREADRTFRSSRGSSAVTYVLHDGEDGPIVYVGCTCYPFTRFREHRHPWDQMEWQHGLDLRMEIVRIASNGLCRRDQTEVIRYDEIDLIASLRSHGVELQNRTDGGEVPRAEWYWNDCPCPRCSPWS